MNAVYNWVTLSFEHRRATLATFCINIVIKESIASWSEFIWVKFQVIIVNESTDCKLRQSFYILKKLEILAAIDVLRKFKQCKVIFSSFFVEWKYLLFYFFLFGDIKFIIALLLKWNNLLLIFFKLLKNSIVLDLIGLFDSILMQVVKEGKGKLRDFILLIFLAQPLKSVGWGQY